MHFLYTFYIQKYAKLEDLSIGVNIFKWFESFDQKYAHFFFDFWQNFGLCPTSKNVVISLITFDLIVILT